MYTSYEMSDLARVKNKATLTLRFQPKYPTYSPETFKKTMDRNGFLLSPGQAKNQAGSQIPLEVFSKDDLVVFQLPNPNNPGAQPEIWVQVLNNFSLEMAYNKIVKELLSEIKIGEKELSWIDVSIVIYVPTDHDPLRSLSSLLKSKTSREIGKGLVKLPMSITSIKIGSKFPMMQDGLELVVEPSATRPTEEFYINLHLNTSSVKAFESFTEDYEKGLIDNFIAMFTGGVNIA